MLLLAALTSACGESHKISFYDGDSLTYTLTVAEKGEIVLPAQPSKEGYIFRGWYFDKEVWLNQLTKDSYLDTAPSSDVKVYAKWEKETAVDPEKKTATVSFDVKGGDAINSITVEVGQTLTLPNNPTRSQYLFKGWYLDEEYQKPFEKGAITSSFTLYARWLEVFSVTFDLGSGVTGTIPTITDKTEGERFELPALSLNREHFTFFGWSDGASVYSAETPYVMPNKSVTFTAQWMEEEKFTATFSAGYGASGTAPSAISCYAGDTITMPANTFTKAHCSFLSWQNKKINYPVGSTFFMPDSDLTFTPVWLEEAKYSATFVGGEGATGTAPTTMTAYNGEYITLPSNTFTKTGYKFSGWSDGSNTYNAGVSYIIPTSNIQFTAIWTQLTQYSATFNGGTDATGTPPTTLTAYNGEYITLPSNTFTRTGYKFSGWSDGTKSYTVGERVRFNNSNFVFTAVWTSEQPITTSSSFDFRYSIPLKINFGGKFFNTVKVNDTLLNKNQYTVNGDYLFIPATTLYDFEIPKQSSGTLNVKVLNGSTEVVNTNVALTNTRDIYASGISLNYSQINITSWDQEFFLTPTVSPSNANVRYYTAGLVWDKTAYGSEYPASFSTSSGRLAPTRNNIQFKVRYYLLNSSDVTAEVNVSVNIPYVEPDPDDLTTINYFALNCDHRSVINKASHSILTTVLATSIPTSVEVNISNDSTGKTNLSTSTYDLTQSLNYNFNFQGNQWTITFSVLAPTTINRLLSFSIPEQVAPAIITHTENEPGGKIYLEVKEGTDLRSLIATATCENYDNPNNLLDINGVAHNYAGTTSYTESATTTFQIYSLHSYVNLYEVTIKVADKYALSSLIANALSCDRRYSTFASWAEAKLDDAIAYARSVMDNELATIALINEAKAKLNTATGKLVQADYRQGNLASLVNEIQLLNLSNYTAASITDSNIGALLSSARGLFDSSTSTVDNFENAYNLLNSARDNLVVDLSKLTLSFDANTNCINGTVEGLKYFVNSYDEMNQQFCREGSTYIDYSLMSSLDSSKQNKVYVYSTDPLQALYLGDIINYNLE